MSKLDKFRRSPSRFFADSPRPLLRGLGARLGRQLEGPRLHPFLLDPSAAAADSSIPLLAPLARAHEARLAARRRARIVAAGEPLVTVIMAACDAAETIEAAIRSILEQRHAALELIVIDDGSEDETPRLVAALAQEDPRVRLERLERRGGAARARNLGLERARGEFITFNDADDRSDPQRLERQLAALLAAPRAMLCTCNHQRVQASGRPLRLNGLRVQKSIISMLFRAAPVRARIGYLRPLRISEDADFYARIKAVFGAEAELRLPQLLYHAAFAPDSLLFSRGRVVCLQPGVYTHRLAPEEQAELERLHAEHARIARGEQDGYAPA
ncbi:MAG: glycosyltransferase family 2 protein [Myxococcales bacterium]|nr:glycosyltransferase family 2 protein [Myxococcales bacterium]